MRRVLPYRQKTARIGCARDERERTPEPTVRHVGAFGRSEPAQILNRHSDRLASRRAAAGMSAVRRNISQKAVTNALDRSIAACPTLVARGSGKLEAGLAALGFRERGI